MKITSIKLEDDIDDHIRNKIVEYTSKLGCTPSTIIISSPLMGWLKKVLMDKCKYTNLAMWKQELNCNLMTFEGLNIIETMRDNIIEIY